MNDLKNKINDGRIMALQIFQNIMNKVLQILHVNALIEMDVI